MLLKSDNSWLGLASYEYKDAYRFFGREKEISELKEAICNNSFTTIYGISGAGKTSLVNAGIIPLLEKENYLPVRVRLDHQSEIGYNTQIIQAITDAIKNIKGEIETIYVLQENIKEEEKLWNFLYGSKFWSNTNHQLIPIVFIDQFEEIFIKNESDEAISSFFETINSLQYNIPPTQTTKLLEKEEGYVELNDVARFGMVFVMREDFLARLEDYSFNISALRKNRRGIKRMNGYQALDVILKPQPDIITRDVAIHILSKVSGKSVKDSDNVLSNLSIDTSILSLFCSELYQKAVDLKLDKITKELVGQFGDDIIVSFYENTINLVSVKTMEYLEAHLLTYSGFRNAVALEDLKQDGVDIEELKVLANTRLIRIEESEGTERVEFMHDVLCKVAKEHRDARKEKIKSKAKARVDRRTKFKYIVYSIVILLLLTVYLPSTMMSVCKSALLLGSTCIIYMSLYKDKLTKKVSTRYIIVGLVGLIISLLGVYSKPRLFVSYQVIPTIIMNYIICIILFELFLVLSYLFKKHNKKNRLAHIFDVLWIISLSIIVYHTMRFAFGFLLLLCGLYVIGTYIFAREKNSFWTALLSGVLISAAMWLCYNSVWSAAGFSGKDVKNITKIVMLISLLISIYSVFRYKKQRSAKETIDYCLSFKVFYEQPFVKKLTYIVFLLIVVFYSFVIGLRCNILHTMIGTLSFGIVSFALLYYLFFNTEFENKNNSNKPKYYILYSILILLILGGIVGTQYLYGRLIWQSIFWVLSILLTYKLYSKSIRKNNKRIPYIIIWFVSFFCIPVLCMGYNVFSLPLYARVYGENSRGAKYFIIKDNKGLLGLRDRFGFDPVIPVEFLSIKDYNQYKFLYEDIDFPSLAFRVVKTDGTQIDWFCHDHLGLNKKYTKKFIKFSEENLLNGSLFEVYEVIYMDYIHSCGDNSKMQQAVEKFFVGSLNGSINHKRRYINDNITLLSMDDVKKYNKNIDADDFINSIYESCNYFPYLNTADLSHLLIDTLLVNCNDYSSDIINYTDLAKYRLYAKDFERALVDAEKGVQLNNDNYSLEIFVEALYFNEKYDEAFDLINKNKNKKNNIANNNQSYKYWGDCLWDDFVDFKNKGVLTDTVSDSFIKLNEILYIEKQRPYYTETTELKQFMQYSSQNKCGTNNKLELCIASDINYRYHYYSKIINGRVRYYPGFLWYKYIMKDGIRVSPIFRHFAVSLDEAMLLIIDEKDAKRKYLDVKGDNVVLLPGVYDHAWRFSEGMAAVVFDGSIGFINDKGIFVIYPTFALPQYDIPEYKQRGINGVVVNYNIWSSKTMGLNKYVDFIFQNGLCPMSGDNGLFGFINKKGEWVVEPEYSYIGALKDGYRIVRKEDKYGIMDANLKLVVPMKFAKIRHDMRNAMFDIDDVLYDYSELSEIQ